jgi:hypothetical protein
MKTIWKFNIKKEYDGITTIEMPADAKIVHVACQRPDIVSFWAEVEVESNDVYHVQRRDFQVIGTGEEIKTPRSREREQPRHIGTALDESYVWHLYEWR